MLISFGDGSLYLAGIGTPYESWTKRPEFGSCKSSCRTQLDCVWSLLLKLLGMYSGTLLFFLFLAKLAWVPSRESANWKDRYVGA